MPNTGGDAQGNAIVRAELSEGGELPNRKGVANEGNGLIVDGPLASAVANAPKPSSKLIPMSTNGYVPVVGSKG